jgi:hypothetical protein
VQVAKSRVDGSRVVRNRAAVGHCDNEWNAASHPSPQRGSQHLAISVSLGISVAVYGYVSDIKPNKATNDAQSWK